MILPKLGFTGSSCFNAELAARLAETSFLFSATNCPTLNKSAEGKEVTVSDSHVYFSSVSVSHFPPLMKQSSLFFLTSLANVSGYCTAD